MAEIITPDDKEDSEENSDDQLKICESPLRKRKPTPEPTASERKIIESIEDELERRLDEKAARTNLNAVNVKNIIKHVVTNEHVLHLIRKVDNPTTGAEDSAPMFEPKLTRSKAKELYSIPGVSWRASKPLSEVQALFTEDLQEDSSGDEYVPGMEDKEGDEDGEKEDESEDDPDSSSIFSDPPSVEPPTPPHVPSCNDSGTQTSWTEDGIFKIPSLPKDNDEAAHQATIALRTRSKLSLSSTPLEVIEEAFIPPDITTDMYEMDCDNEDWMNFLKTFNRPLDEIVKAPEIEEEELDPEYNVLADEEVDKPDKEELRVDKAVKVSRKELNDLLAELYEFCTNEQAYLDSIDEEDGEGNSFSINQLLDPSALDSSKQDDANVENNTNELSPKTELDDPDNKSKENGMITSIQISLLEQQLRQHVQLLCQNFLLTYQHPELHHHAIQMKEYLLNLRFLAADKEKSMFHSLNLENAINMVGYWENLFAYNTEEVKKMKRHVEKTIHESLQAKRTGTQYIPTFPTLTMETISKSSVFLYPSLLPRIPFKSPRCFSGKFTCFTEPELQLIAFGLEEFTPVAKADNKFWFTKKIKMRTAEYIHKYMLPIKQPMEIYRKIAQMNYSNAANNPIKYYFQFKKAPTLIQYIMPLDEMKVLPPCERQLQELPHQWKNYIFKENVYIPVPQVTTLVINSYPGLQVNPITKPNSFEKPVFSKGPISGSTPVCPRTRVRRVKRYSRTKRQVTDIDSIKQDPITKFVNCLCRPSPISKVLELFLTNNNLDSNMDRFSILESQVKAKKSGTEKHTNVSLEDKTLEFSIDSSSNEVIRVSNTSTGDIELTTSPIKLEEETGKTEQCMATLKNMPSLFTPVKKEPETGSAQNISEKVTNIAKRNISADLPDPGVSNFSSIGTLIKESTATEKKVQDTPKDDQDDINALLIASSTVKPAAKKNLSSTEKKHAKLKKEFLANLSILTPEDPIVEKQKSENFAMAYYDKMRETLQIESYHKIMQILNEYEEGDAVNLYYKIEEVLRPRYEELADEFLMFLREREAAAVGRLVPWIRMNNRSKFLKKLEIFFKDQPSQLKKIYQCLTELTQTVGIPMDKIKSKMIPMFKGNTILTDLFLQNFLDGPPPPSLLEGPYETIDVNKEMSRPDNEEPYETIVIPDMEDKYGGTTCICSCHEIEDAEFKSRFRHCTRCGIRFINGQVFMQTGQGLRPTRVSFLNSSTLDHQSRLADKSLLEFYRRKKRSHISPSKASSSAKDNHDEETDEDGDKKKKSKRKPPQRNKKQKLMDGAKETPKKGSGTNKGKNSNKDLKPATPRKRTNSMKKALQTVKTENVIGSEERFGNETEEHNETEIEHNEIEIEHNETKIEKHNETELEEHNETEQEEPNETEFEEHNETELEEPNETELEDPNETEVEDPTETELEDPNETELEDPNETELEEHLQGAEDKIYSKPGTNEGQIKRLHEESCEEEQSAAGESSGEVKLGSPEQQTAESESEFCEESSQDNCESDSNSSSPATPKSYAEVLEQNLSWNREEDKIILEVFQMENDKDNAFRAIANQLSHRSVDEIKSRFETLMDLLMKTVDNHRD